MYFSYSNMKEKENLPIKATLSDLAGLAGIAFSEGIKAAFNSFWYHVPKGCEAYESLDELRISSLRPVVGVGKEIFTKNNNLYLIGHIDGQPYLMGRIVKWRRSSPHRTSNVWYCYIPQADLDKEERFGINSILAETWRISTTTVGDTDYR